MEKLVLIHVDDIEYHKIQNIASRMKIDCRPDTGRNSDSEL